MAATHFGKQFHTTDARHLQVGNDRVELPAVQSREGFLAIAGGGALIYGRRVRVRGVVTAGRFVVDDKNACRKLASWWNLGNTSFRSSPENLISLSHQNV